MHPVESVESKRLGLNRISVHLFTESMIYREYKVLSSATVNGWLWTMVDNRIAVEFVVPGAEAGAAFTVKHAQKLMVSFE